ncbi:MAG: SDR family NAD(P)-dependent oxidoreductase [Gammaproteobacteria bacterium]
MKTAVITGVSSGIGFELAKALLKKNFNVYGISRRTPKELFDYENFNFLCIDLNNFENLTNKISEFLIKKFNITKIDYLFLNAGEFNKRIAPISDTPISEYDYLMRVNVWSYKIILDVLLRASVLLDTVIFSSSISSLRARKGMGAYAISKAALNMMAKLYALEHPEVFFSVLGLCNVNTFVADNILNLPLLGDFNELAELRDRASIPGYLTSPFDRAEQILLLLESDLKKKSTSGEFIEIRQLLEINRITE